jgi:ubiquinone/menaquinone biosynthesis C-methylase UbiE
LERRPHALAVSAAQCRRFDRPSGYLARMSTTPEGWDRHVHQYATLFAPLTSYIGRSMFTMVEPSLRADASVLDIACGTGAVALPAIERAMRTPGGSGRVVASDFSPGMVEEAKRAASALGDTSAVASFDVQNGEALRYAAASFDAVFSCFGIFLFGDRIAGWREAARVLKPGGTFATSVWRSPEHNPMLRAQMAPVVKALPQRLLQPRSGGWIEIAEASALMAEVNRDGNWVNMHCAPFQATIAFGRPQQVWDAMRDNPVLGALLAECTEPELEIVKRSVLESFKELAGGDNRPLLLDSVCNILVATRAG